MINLKQNEWDKKSSSEALKNCEVIISELESYSYEFLNEYHNYKFTKKEIKILLGSWIYYFSHICYDRHLSIKKNKENISYVLDESNFEFPPFDSGDFTAEIANSDKYNFQIYALIGNFYLKNQNLNFLSKPVYLTKKNNIGPIKSIFYFILKSLSRDNKVLVANPYVNRIDQIKLALNFRNFAQFEDFNIQYSFRYNIEMKKRIDIYEKLKNKFSEKYYFYLFIFYLPTSLVECYKNVKVKYEKYKFKKSKFFFTSLSILYSNIFIKLYLIDNKPKVINRYHGGGYRVFKSLWFEKFERENSDFTLIPTKDKSRHQKEKYISPNIDINLRKKNINLLVVLMSNTKFVSSFIGYPISESSKKWDDKTISFIKKINDLEIVIKLPSSLPWANEFNSNSINALGKKSNYYIDQKGKDALSLMKSSRLVFLNYLGTAFMESIALNIPTVCMYDKKIYDFSDEFKNLEKSFLDNGIFQTDPQKCEKFIRSIYSDPMLWWKSETVQISIQNFRKLFFDIHPNWKQNWKKQIVDLISHN